MKYFAVDFIGKWSNIQYIAAFILDTSFRYSLDAALQRWNGGCFERRENYDCKSFGD